MVASLVMLSETNMLMFIIDKHAYVYNSSSLQSHSNAIDNSFLLNSPLAYFDSKEAVVLEGV